MCHHRKFLCNNRIGWFLFGPNVRRHTDIIKYANLERKRMENCIETDLVVGNGCGDNGGSKRIFKRKGTFIDKRKSTVTFD